ncbi:MAG: hypothetical protein V7744_19990 [Pseudomonadales bacterium]
MAMKRSLKYQAMTDEELLDLFINDKRPKDDHYLNVELVERDLLEQAENFKVDEAKKKPRKTGPIIFAIMIFCVFAFRYAQKYI